MAFVFCFLSLPLSLSLSLFVFLSFCRFCLMPIVLILRRLLSSIHFNLFRFFLSFCPLSNTLKRSKAFPNQTKHPHACESTPKPKP